MFARGYFPASFFAPTYYPPATASGTPSGCFRFDSDGFTLDRTDQKWDQTICPVESTDRLGAGATRRYARRKRIEHEQRIVEEFLQLQQKRAAIVLRKRAPLAAGAGPAEIDEDFRRQYWAHFMALALRYYN